jgi:hypothetical protein
MHRYTSRALIVALASLWLSPVAFAQTVINPSRAEFDSADHAVACPADNCISGYRVEIWLPSVDPSTGAPVSQAVVPKASVVASGLTSPAYKIDRANWGVSFTPGTTYVLRLVSVGEGTVESAKSLPSGPFARTATPPRVASAVRVAAP